jgi:predicted transcriptional regulator
MSKRTTVILDDDDENDLDFLAQRWKKSKMETIRMCIRDSAYNEHLEDGIHGRKS